MEFGNIGNYYIIEPFIRELHRVFPDANIRTTLQMSERFCKDEDIEVIPMEYYYDFDSENNLETAKKELEIVKNFKQTGELQESTGYIDTLLDSDIVIDFSGDMWGDNANFLGKDRFEVGLYKDKIAQDLKPTFLLAGSPGPFNDVKTKDLAKEVFENFTHITNREPISKRVLKRDGFDVSNVSDLACPAFLFEPRKDINVQEILKKEGIKDQDKPVIGFILCGWNFTTGPFDKWPRDDKDYDVFKETLDYMSKNINANIVLMSHSNGFPIPPAEFELQHGRDYPIIKQLKNIMDKTDEYSNIYSLDGVYDAWTIKAIIREFDMLVSGRVHGAVAGFSQKVPTVVIDYGHEPKAHKLQGFAEVVNKKEFVAAPDKENDLINKIKKCWVNRNKVEKDLANHIPKVKELVKKNFEIISKYI
jgi:colanic acid/amylovoran biosynthesis protein